MVQTTPLRTSVYLALFSTGSQTGPQHELPIGKIVSFPIILSPWVALTHMLMLYPIPEISGIGRLMHQMQKPFPFLELTLNDKMDREWEMCSFPKRKSRDSYQK